MKEDLNKALPGMPSATAPKQPKMPSLAPKSAKSPVKQLEQVGTPQMKDLAMRQAKSVEASMKNPMAMNKGEEPKDEDVHYHIMQNGKRLTSDPIPHSYIKENLGGIEKLASAGYSAVPVSKEKLVKAPNGQWTLEKY